MSQMRELESDFWSQWRMRWGPKLIVSATFCAVGTVASCVMDYAQIDLRYRKSIAEINARSKAPVMKPTDSLIAARAKVVGPYCNAKVNQTNITEESRHNWWNSEQTDPVSGITFDCSHWIWYAGIR